MHVLSVVAVILVSVVLSPVITGAQSHPGLILAHGKVWTENPQQPEAEAVAVSGNRIIAVGDSASVLALVGPQTTVIDLKGRRVVPGFNDAHVHFYMGGDV